MLATTRRTVPLAALTAVAMLLPAGVAGAATIKVTDTADGHGGSAGCKLREAITAANTDAAVGGCSAGSGADEVRLEDGAVYTRSIDGLNENVNATGDLDVYSEITIGPKKGKATIDAGGYDRVIEVLADGDLTLSRVTLTGAAETYPPDVVDGMGINSSGKLKTSRVKVTGNSTFGNSSNNGGGIVIRDGKALLDRTTVSFNEADNVGGGIAMYAGNLTIKKSTIANNESGYAGGGMYLGGSSFDPDKVTIKDSTVSGNTADYNGGGIYASLYGTDDVPQDPVNLANVTVSGNEAEQGGGGIFQYVGEVSLQSSTVTGNTANIGTHSVIGQGGGLSGSISYANSIVYGNTDLNPVDPTNDCYSASSLGHNVVGKDTGCVTQESDSKKDPKLRKLAKNGGPTATHALKKGSSALGLAKKASSPKKDQRGVKRDKDPDSGAYER